MTRDEVYRDIESVFGLVPTMFTRVPDRMLEPEWRLFKAMQFEDGVIPTKYRELIGVAVSAAIESPYCAIYHTETAKTAGATDEEIEEAVHYAKSSVGWSAYVAGLQTDLGRFKDEVARACGHVRTARGGGLRVGVGPDTTTLTH